MTGMRVEVEEDDDLGKPKDSLAVVPAVLLDMPRPRTPEEVACAFAARDESAGPSAAANTREAIDAPAMVRENPLTPAARAEEVDAARLILNSCLLCRLGCAKRKTKGKKAPWWSALRSSGDARACK
jgi:hypothetical protein